MTRIESLRDLEQVLAVHAMHCDRRVDEVHLPLRSLVAVLREILILTTGAKVSMKVHRDGTASAEERPEPPSANLLVEEIRNGVPVVWRGYALKILSPRSAEPYELYHYGHGGAETRH